jgi:hypothetical protein
MKVSSWCLKNERTSGSDDGRWETGENHKMVKRRRIEVKRKREILAALDIADEKYTQKEMIRGELSYIDGSRNEKALTQNSCWF